MYTDGTGALKTEYRSKTSQKKVVRGTAKKTPKRVNKRNVRLMKKRIVCAILLAFVMAFTVLLRYAVISKEYGELSKAREELELINAKVVEKQVVAEGNLDPKRIDQEAERLGLQQPVNSQIEYVSLGNTDSGEVIKTEETSALSAFINRLSVILEYIY